MPKGKTNRNPRGHDKDYSERTDAEKIHTQWHKLTGLHNREEWSAAATRAATAAEIAANLAIRIEFKDRSSFSAVYVDSLLLFANGLDGKMKRLLLPMFAQAEKVKYAGLQSLAEAINRGRNKIVHQGDFMDEDDSKELIETSRQFIQKLLRIYEPGFTLADREGYSK
jgi:hypothetical protein